MIDLHLHLDGSMDAEEILFLAKENQIQLPEYRLDKLRELLSVKEDCNSLTEYLTRFDLPLLVLQSADAMEMAVYSLIKRLALQGLLYAEIRFAPQLHTKCGLSQKEIILAAIRGLKKGIKEFQIKAGLILCCMRGKDNYKENMETVRLGCEFYQKGVCGVDLAGDESSYPTGDYYGLFEQAKEEQVPITIHAGEAAGSESVRAALQLGAKRIGHGIRILQDEALIDEIKEREIVLETCFTSNLQTKAIERPKDHPLYRLYKMGVLVTVNTDNMTVSDTNLKKEYDRVCKQFDLTKIDCKQLMKNAIKGAFISENEKKELESTLNEVSYHIEKDLPD